MKKTTYSLVEILIATVLVVTITGTLSFSLSSFAEVNRFEQSAKLLKMQLQLASDLVLEKGVDVEVVLKSEKDRLICSLKSDHPTVIPKQDRTHIYPKIKSAHIEESHNFRLALQTKRILVAPSGSNSKPFRLHLYGPKGKHYSYSLKDFPHVIQSEV